MISFDEALDRVRASAKPLGVETIGVAEAAGRVLAGPVVARIDSPRADVSEMDGYAVRDADLENLPATLEVRGESFPGASFEVEVEPGACVRIFTGARIPSGADRVVMQEHVSRNGQSAIIGVAPGPPRYIRTRGSDFTEGDVLLDPGRLLDPRAIVAAAASDLPTLKVYRRPRVIVLTTGDELVEPGTAHARADAVPDSVSVAIAALCAQWGCDIRGRERLGDDLALMQRAASKAVRNADLVVVTGGASVGERDFAKAMFEPLGLELLFEKVAMKPGKPVWLGRASDRLVLGLPGNPTSAFVTARLLLAPLLAGLTGRPVDLPLAWRSAPLAGSLPQCAERESFHRARLIGNAADILPVQQSGAQKWLADADVLVRQAANSPALEAGAVVQILDF